MRNATSLRSRQSYPRTPNSSASQPTSPRDPIYQLHPPQSPRSFTFPPLTRRHLHPMPYRPRQTQPRKPPHIHRHPPLSLSSQTLHPTIPEMHRSPTLLPLYFSANIWVAPTSILPRFGRSTPTLSSPRGLWRELWGRWWYVLSCLMLSAHGR